MAQPLSPFRALPSRRGRVARRLGPVALVLALVAAAAPAVAQSRGELLYTTHCISCHSEQMHWRDQRAARDWSSLAYQVRRWQAAASLGWTEADILEVARHLNDSIYRFTPTPEPRSSVWPGGVANVARIAAPAR
jgi:mono/diheme cytochrome c family protein